jgi:hypothetical protein
LAKISGIQQHNLFSRLGAFLLLLIFLSVPLVEALHHHVNFCEGTETTDSHQSDFQKKSGVFADGHHLSFHKFQSNPEKHLTASQVKCKLCDLIRNHTQQACLPALSSLSFNTTILQTLRWHFILQSSSAFILACANKGPPANML